MRHTNWLFVITVATLLATSAPAVAQQEQCCSFRVRHNFSFCLNQGQVTQGTWYWNLNAFVAPPPSTNTNAGSMNFTIPPTPFSQTQTVTNQITVGGRTCAISSATATIFIDQVPGSNCYRGYHEVSGRACAFCRGYRAGAWGSTSVFIPTPGTVSGQIGWQPVIQDQVAGECGVATQDPVKLKVRDRNTNASRVIELFDLVAEGWDVELDSGGQMVIRPSGNSGDLQIRMDGAEVGAPTGELRLSYSGGVFTVVQATGVFTQLPLPNVGDPIRDIPTGRSEVPLSFDVPPHLELLGIEMGGGGRAGEIPIPGDVDGNGCVDDADLLRVLFAFGGAGGPEDVNGDGAVDDADLLIVLFNFGQGC